MARSMIVHARIPDSFLYHAICYASAVFNVLPVSWHQYQDSLALQPALSFIPNINTC
jgi:hypothetical protein